jgi:hypothetical protein
MSDERSRRRRKLAWIVATKVAFTLAVMLPLHPRGAVEYWAPSGLSGVRAGTPVVRSGQLIGQVVATSSRGDTTFLRLRFTRGAERLPHGDLAELVRVGLGQDDVALEFHGVPRRGRLSPGHGGWLRVIRSSPARDLRPEVVPLPTRLPEQPPLLQLIPLAPTVTRWVPPVSA